MLSPHLLAAMYLHTNVLKDPPNVCPGGLYREQLHDLPVISFDFHGQKINVTADEYMHCGSFLFGWEQPGEWCELEVGERWHEFDNGTIEFGVKETWLGGPFLRKAYSVYNWEDKTISCKSSRTLILP